MGVEISVLLLSTTLLLLFIFKVTLATKRCRDPPGPKQLPIIGNLLDFPREKQWAAFTKWRKDYGDIIHLNVLGTSTVVLNSREKCIDLLDKRSSKYSGRPRSVMLTEFMGADYSFAIMDYAPRWRRYRRLFHQYFNEHASLAYRPIQEQSIYHFLQRLLVKPEDFLDHIRLLFGETILDIVYGIKAEDRDNIFIQTAEKAMEAALQVTIPGRFLVEFFPAMKYLPSWFPGGTFKKFAEMHKQNILDAKDLPFSDVKERMETGNAGPSVLASMLEMCDRDISKWGGDEAPEEVAKGCAGVAYVAGADTTLATIQALFVAIANHQSVQHAAWKELDALLGPSPNRLPTHADAAQLPFITAITKEILRWHNVVPLGVPHVLTEDDEYNGYVIRKGTLVLANIWGILHDPDVYPEPFNFNPWRWLVEGPEGKLRLNSALPDSDAVFGFGRRGCPGRHFALNTLFGIVATVLTCFEVKPLDAHGQPTDHIEEEFTNGLISYPVPYKASIVPRSAHLAQLIKDLAA